MWAEPQSLPALPIGMNLSSVSFFNLILVFTDVMKTASAFLTTYRNGIWNTGMLTNRQAF